MQTLKPFCYRKPLSVLYVLLLTASYSIAQNNTTAYKSLKDDTTAYIQIENQVEQRYKSDVASLKSENKKYVSEIYKERLSKVKSMTAHRELVTNPEVQEYLNALTSHIVNSNAQLVNLAPRFYFSRSAVPNAYSMGDGTIVFNLGLFTKLNSEAQVAFVLCHELAHLYLNHSNKSIANYVDKMYSKEMQQQLKRLNATVYQRNTQLDNLARQFSFSSSRHSRDHETEADSLGVVFLQNTRFNTKATIEVLGILDTVDVDNFNTNTFLQQTFTWNDYPFQPRWTAKEEGLLGGHASLETDKKLEDSLKTHPDCQIRIKAVSPAITASTGAEKLDYVVSKEKFTSYQKLFAYEIAEHYANSNNLSASLYFCLQLLQKDSTDAYVIATIGKILASFYIAQKQHRLGYCTSQPAPHFSSSYNNLLQFIQNLYIEDMAGINYFFLKQYEQKLVSNEDYVFALTLSKQQNNKAQEHTYWKEYYNKSFTPKKYNLN